MKKITIRFSLLIILLLCYNNSYGQIAPLVRTVKAAKSIFKTSKKASKAFSISKSTINNLPKYYRDNPYSNSHLYDLGRKPNYPDDIYEYISKNNILGESNSLFNSSNRKIFDRFEKERISKTKEFLKKEGYLPPVNFNFNDGIWDKISQKALKRYHKDVKRKLALENDLASKIRILDDFNQNIPKELVLYSSKHLKEDIIIDLSREIVLSQKSLKDLGYYKGKIDGVFGSNSKRALTEFKKDYNLESTRFGFISNSNNPNDPIKVSIDKGSDFTKLWKENYNFKSECSPSLCFNNEEIKISLECNNVNIEFSTEKEITVSLTNSSNRKYEKTFNSSSSENQDSDYCKISVEVCLSSTPDFSFSICNISFNASTNGDFKMTSSRSILNRPVKIW